MAVNNRRSRVGIGLAAGAIAAASVSAGPTTAPADRAVYNVPLLDQISVDGDPADWAGRGFAVAVLHAAPPRRLPADQFDAQVRVGWTTRGLLVLADVTDPGRRESLSDVEFDNGASVEIVESNARGKDGVRLRISPGVDPAHPAMRTLWYDDRPTALRATPLTAVVAARRTAAGYAVEAEVPWGLLRLSPTAGTEFGLEVRVNHADGSGGAHLTWPTGRWLADVADPFPVVRLAEVASPPVSAVADGQFDRFRRTRISVAAVDGGTARVTADGRRVADLPLRPAGRFATTQMSLPMPAVGQPMPPVTVAVNGRPVGVVSFPDISMVRADALAAVPVVGSPSVFASPALPAVDFDSPAAAEDLIGDYTIRTTHFDADFRPVTTADRPGRYGSIAEVVPTVGPPFKRYVTLYRTPADTKLSPMHLRATVAFPAALGIDPAVAAQQSIAAGLFVADAMRAGRFHVPSLAVLLAGLSETPPGSADVPNRLGPTGRDLAWWYECRKRTGNLPPYPRLVHVPDGVSAGAKLPLILFLHGSGERGTKLDAVKEHGPPRVLRDDPAWPYRDRFIVVSPQCPAQETWSPLQVRDLLDDIVAHYPVDPDRVYLTGLSLGGYGTWETALWFPERFAAIVPVCGGGDPTDVGRLKDVPTWVFHGGRDPAVRVENSYEMVRALRDVHGRVRFTLYPDYPHNSWDPAYDDPALYDWLLAQRRGRPTQPPATTAGTRPAAE